MLYTDPSLILEYLISPDFSALLRELVVYINVDSEEK
jgi:hypothetical protein